MSQPCAKRSLHYMQGAAEMQSVVALRAWDF